MEIPEFVQDKEPKLWKSQLFQFAKPISAFQICSFTSLSILSYCKLQICTSPSSCIKFYNVLPISIRIQSSKYALSKIKLYLINNSYLFYLLLNCKRHLFELSLDVEKSF
ncbi:unnamed protein product [Tenebrio molitor]|nr:unnamed protein product [Tenebrio molitor]